MDAVAAFKKLFEYEQRSRGEAADADGGGARQGGWAGVIFRIGDDQLVCNIEHVHEFLPLPATTPVPGSKSWLLGLANVRGDLMTIVDLSGFLSGERSPVTMRTRVLTATLRGRPVGLLVDEVYGHRQFTSSGKKAKVARSSPLAGYVRQQYRSGNETWSELDLDTLFTTPDFLNGSAH